MFGRTFPILTLGLCLIMGATYMWDPMVAYTADHSCTPRTYYVNAGGAFRSLFSHADSQHIIGNSLSLFSLGLIMEMVHGHWRFILICMYGGIVGSLGWSAFEQDGRRLVGASSCVYAVASSYASHLFLNWNETPFKLLFAAALSFSISMDVLHYVYNRQENIAYSAHLFGSLTGALTGIIFLRNSVVHGYELRVVSISCIFCLTLSVFLILSSSCPTVSI